MAVLVRTLAALLLLLSPGPAMAVFGGKTVDPASPVASSLVAIVFKGPAGQGLCTGTLIAPTLVLTAAHCTVGEQGDIRIVFAARLENVPPDRLRAARQIARPPDWQPGDGTAFNNPADIALIALDSPAPPNAIAARLTGDSAAGAFQFAGFGAFSELARPDASGTKRPGFDRTLRSTILQLTDRDGLLVADQSAGTGVCTGDSGGPILRLDGNDLTVAGVLIGVSNRRGTNDVCRGRAWFNPLGRWTAWLVDQAAGMGVTLR